jgi:hypothetical protein
VILTLILQVVVKYLPLFYHFKAIYQCPKHIIVWVKIVANASLKLETFTLKLSKYLMNII